MSQTKLFVGQLVKVMGNKVTPIPNAVEVNFLPEILPRLRCPRHFCFPSELVRSVHRFGLGCCGLRLEPREFALGHLWKADDVDMLLEL